MIKNKDVVLHTKEFSGITNATSLEKNCAVPGVVPPSNLHNLEVLRRCNSLPLFMSNHVFCDWKKRNPNAIQNRLITSYSYRQSVNSTDTPTFNYELYNHQTETKSLQELQIEVDALLEFRDLVIETFPDLKNKIISMSSAAISANDSKIHTSPRSQTKKKKLRKDSHKSLQGQAALNTAVIIGEPSPAFVSRSRSNSNSCKKEPKSGEGSGSVVQDSGFSTETTSSKDGHSASSTSGVLQGTILPNRVLNDSDDELLNLLDVIYRKTSRFRKRISSMQNYERDKNETYLSSASFSNIVNSSIFQRKLQKYSTDTPSKENLLVLRNERDKLLDKMAELESEVLEGRIKILHMKQQLQSLTSGNNNLEEQLKVAVNQNQELNFKLLRSASDSSSRPCVQPSNSEIAVCDTCSSVAKHLAVNDQINKFSPKMSCIKDLENRRHQKTALSIYGESSTSGCNFNLGLSDTKETVSAFRLTRKCNLDFMPKSIKEDIKSLGRMDAVFNHPKFVCKSREIDSKKVAAILLETNLLELKRQLLTLTVQNQVLIHKLEEALKSKLPLPKRQSCSKEEMIAFKTQGKRICPESAEKTPSIAVNYRKPSQNVSVHQIESAFSSITSSNTCLSPVQKDVNIDKEEQRQRNYCVNCARNQDNDNQTIKYEETFQPPKRSKPSKIPLPGTKPLYSSRTIGYMSNGSSPTLTTIHKSLSYSTGNIFFRNNTSRLNRQDSLFLRSRGSSSSISTDTKVMSHNLFITSPLPKIKRDSVTARIRQLDYSAPAKNSKASEKIQTEQKSIPYPKQLIAQNKLNKINSSLFSTVINNSPITSPTRIIRAKKVNNISMAAKRNNVIRKDPDSTPAAAKKIGNSNQTGVQAFIGSSNTNNSSSITNSSISSSLVMDDPYNDVDIGKVRNLRSALLGWLKI